MLVSKLLEQNRLVPVVVIDNKEQAIGLSNSLLEAGISVIEVTLRNEYGLQAMREIKQHCPQMTVLAGTVTNTQMLKEVEQIGVEAVVTPGLTPALLDYAQQQNIALLPGVTSPSEILLAMQYGFTECKLFPASIVGGVDMLKALAGPFADIKFCPTGGISNDNCLDYLALPNVMCVGGSWMIDKQAVISQNWQQVKTAVEQAVSSINIG